MSLGGEKTATKEPVTFVETLHPGAPHPGGLDFAGLRHRKAKGLTVLARFAGRAITQDDLNVINAADRAYALGGTIGTTPPASRRRDRGRTS